MARMVDIARSLSHGLSLLEVADQLGTNRIIRVVAPFRERFTAIKRAILLTIVTLWCFAWTRGHQPVLVSEAIAVLPIAAAFLTLSLCWLAWLRLRVTADTLSTDLVGTAANFVGLAILLEYAPILLISLAAMFPLMCIAIGAKYGRLAFYAGLACTVLIIALIPPAGYWATRPAYAVYALTLAVGVPLAVSRVLSALREISMQAVESRNSQKRFLSTMSHELRTPLNTLLNAASLVDSRDLSPSNRILFETILSNAGALSNRVQDTLDMSAVDEGRIILLSESFSLATVFEVVSAVSEPAARSKGVSLYVAEDPLVGTSLSGDARRIEQVLTNLVGNAIKFTPPGGRVELLCTAQASENNSVCCSFAVTDTGPGIPDASKKRVFEPFYQLPQQNNSSIVGAGLGLSIAASISQEMLGNLSVEDNPAGGSIFRWKITLPIAEASPRVAPQSANQAIEWHRNHVRPLRILVADDSRPNREMAAKILTSAGHRVDVADDGLKALAVIQAERFDIVLLDVQMPGLTGWQVLTALAPTIQLPASAKFVVLTALNDMESVETAKRLGAASFLSKPLYPQALLECVRTMSVVPSGPASAPGGQLSQLLSFREIASGPEYVAFVSTLISELEQCYASLKLAVREDHTPSVVSALHSLQNVFGNADFPAGLDACRRYREGSGSDFTSLTAAYKECHFQLSRHHSTLTE